MTRIKGIVVCPQPRAADVGADILRRGGTAFDAALATAFCQMVQDPFMCGIGGMGTLQFLDARSGRHGMIDFHARAGAGVRPTCGRRTARAAPRSPATRCSRTSAPSSATPRS